ncbi:MAG: DJ-1/PfpI family protein [Candidatus Angelobacter sp.]
MSPADGFLKAVPATGTQRKTIGIPLYSNFDSLDVLGPFQTFTMAADRLEPKLLAANKKPVRSFEGVEITPHATFGETKSLDVLFVPGGIKLEEILEVGGPKENPLLAFLQRISKPDKEMRPKLITSVCTGALLLAASGLLQGFRATTHWNYKSILAMFPGVTVTDGYPRFVIDANRITGGGISSGLDEAMAIVALLLDQQTARNGQLTMQYAPNPPFEDGDPSVAGPAVLFEVTNSMREGVTKTAAGFEDYIQKWGSQIAS